MKEKHVHEQDTVLLTKTKQCKKSICPSLLKTPTPFSFLRALDPFLLLGDPENFLSTYLNLTLQESELLL